MDDHLLSFAGNERPGTIAVYSLDPDCTGMMPQFQMLYTDNIPQDGRSYNQMYSDSEVSGLDPESLL